MSLITTERLQIHYRQGGAGMTPIVFIHGNYASSRWWQPLLVCVPGGYLALAPDLRGCGSRMERSSHEGIPIRDISIKVLVEDLNAFVQALGFEQVVLVGHSLGGLVATTFAMDYPERIQALVLVDTAPVEGLALGKLTTPLLLPLELKARGMMKRGLQRAGIPRSGDFAEALIDDALAAPRGLYYQFSRAAAAWQAGEKIGRIRAPTMLIWGRDDQVMPKSNAQGYLEAITGAELALIDHAGHSPHLEQPEQFVDSLFTFLDKHTENGRQKPSIENCKDEIGHYLRKDQPAKE